MFAVERLGSYISKGVYTVSGPFHIFGGAVDIIVVQHPDGSFKSAPWYVKFGKFQGVLKSKEKVVTISVNGSEAGFHMYLDHKGEAYFLKEEEEEEESIIIVSSSSSSSSSGEELDEPSQIPSPISISADHNSSDQLKNSPHIDTSTANGKIAARSRSRILGFVFGRKSDDDKNRQGKNSNDNVQRISSLERAEIAADLLEMKWSTNLPTHNFKASAIHPRVTNDASFLSASSSSSSSDKQYEHTLISSSSSPSIPSGISDSTPNKSIMFHDEIGVTTDDDLGTRVLESEYSHELSPRSTGVLFNKENLSVHCAGSSDTQKQIFDISDPRCSGLMDSLGRLSELSMPDYSDNVCEEKGTPSLSLLSPDAAGVQVSLSICTSSRQNNELLENFISAEQIGNNSNKNYSKATRVSTFEVDFVHEQGLKQNVSDKEPELHTESSSTPTGSRVLTGKGNLYQCTCSEIGLSIDEEDCRKFDTVDADCEHDGDLDRCDCSELRLLVGEVSRKFDAANADYRKEETSKMLISNTSDMDASAMNGGDDLVTESPHSLDIHLQRSDSIEAEAVEVFHSDDVPDKKRVAYDTMTVNVILEKNLEAEPSEVSQNTAESMSSSSSSLCRLGDNERLDQGSGAQMLREEIFKDPKSHAPMANLSNTIPRVQEFENLGYEVEMYELGLSSKVIVIPQESVCMQDDQFHFSDSDIFASSGVSRELSSSTDIEEEDYPPPLACDGVEEQRVPNSIRHGSSMALSLESQPFPSNSKPGEVGTRSTPINVPQIYRLSRKAKRLPESLPNIMSHIRDLGSSDVLHPLSSSLDLNSEHLKWGSMFKEFSSSLKMEGTPEGEYSIPDQPATEVADDELAKSPSELEIEGILAANPAVELSLCKHLLFEGMGTDAASKVFDAEKMSHEKIIALVGGLSSIVKNDRLVVRIDDHYFPWDAAAPIILGMVSFGPEQIFTPQGMISVNRVEKTLDKYPSVPAGISWNLWPFSFKKSKALSSVPSPRRDPNATNANSASGNVRGIMPENSMRRRNPLKKKVRSLIPTSKQLASLNLREGQNVITFSFSTAMLGRQQVDARIYLWKWNTQIVISDVDGTITKSDVLGQFMPLVGKDWSQSGVAHLFSAIKGNGYQLLFLSARAISQAYLTRQFLLNLKQDGEALPDGPVVISPDGLFPSLFREVIRRTPHEFKISCLEGIRALFPPNCNPFYAGFGNRDTDEISYLKVGIPKGKIFTINPKGEVAVNRRVNTKSYTSLHSLVDNMFPAMYSEEQEDFNSWNYWKVPLPDINI